MTRVVLSLVDSGNGYQQLLHEDAKAAANRASLELETHFCESDFAKQLEQLGNALEQQPAALVVMAVHGRGLGRMVRRAAAAGVHTVFLNETEDDLDEIRKQFPGVAVCQMCADEEETGRVQGRIARALLPGGGRPCSSRARGAASPHGDAPQGFRTSFRTSASRWTAWRRGGPPRTERPQHTAG